MKTLNILCLLASTITFAKGYKISCKKYYTTSGTEKCLSIVNKNELSLTLFNTLNPDINCDNPIPDNTLLCVSGKPIISFDGTCGPKSGSCPFGECCSNGKCGKTKDFCGASCDPNYGICRNLLAGGNISKSGKTKTEPEDFDKSSIETISKLFSLKTDDAKKFYNYSNQAIDIYDIAFLNSVRNNLTVKECKQNCAVAHTKFGNLLNFNTFNFSLDRYNKFLKTLGQPDISKTELLELCNNQCYAYKELKEYVAEEELRYKKLIKNKRATDPRRDPSRCYNTSEAKFNVVSNYLHGYNKYTEASNSVITALTFVNGCSIPVIKDLYNENNNGLFVPACNVHDICYGCQGGKASCDTTFLNNMKDICKKQKKNSLICRATASIFYAAVRVGANKNYNACSSNRTEKECAYCGAPTIQNYLLKTPYYTI